MLRNHPEHEAVVQQRALGMLGEACQEIERPFPNLSRVPARLFGREQRQPFSRSPRVGEGVVKVIHVRPHEAGLSDRAKEPLLLIVGDMREVPDQRGHELRVLSGEELILQRLEQGQEIASSLSQLPLRAILPALGHTGK
jgi:hypothetical protein